MERQCKPLAHRFLNLGSRDMWHPHTHPGGGAGASWRVVRNPGVTWNCMRKCCQVHACAPQGVSPLRIREWPWDWSVTSCWAAVGLPPRPHWTSGFLIPGFWGLGPERKMGSWLNTELLPMQSLKNRHCSHFQTHLRFVTCLHLCRLSPDQATTITSHQDKRNRPQASLWFCRSLL